MPAGLQVFNDSNTVQIDSNWQNYSLFSRVVINSSKNAWQEIDYAGSVYTTTNARDIVFVYCASPFLPVGMVQQGGTRSYRIGTGTSENIPVTFYIFREQTPTDSSYGMQVFNEQGVLTFDALNKMNRLSGTLPLTPTTAPTFYNLNGFKKYAVLIPNFIGQLIQQDTGAGSGGMGFRYLSTNSTRLQIEPNGVSFLGFAISSVRQIPIPNPSPGITVTNVSGSPYLVSDVTGYD